MPKNSPETRLRWTLRRDVGEILAIDEHGYPDDRWSEEELVKLLAKRSVASLVAARPLKSVDVASGATCNHDIATGFVVMQCLPTYIRIIKLAVHPIYTRFGIGTMLINKVKEELQRRQLREISQEIREQNQPAHQFLRANDFRAIQLLTDYFSEPKEDGYLFRFSLDEAQPMRIPCQKKAA